jgi:hypothetical protein
MEAVTFVHCFYEYGTEQLLQEGCSAPEVWDLLEAVVRDMEKGHLSVDAVDKYGQGFVCVVLQNASHWTLSFMGMSCIHIHETMHPFAPLIQRLMALGPNTKLVWRDMPYLHLNVRDIVNATEFLWEDLTPVEICAHDWVQEELQWRQWLRSARRAWIAATVHQCM